MAGSKVGQSDWRMTGALFFVVAVLVPNTVLGSNLQSDGASTNTCSLKTTPTGISVAVNTETKMASFVCGSDVSQVMPPVEDTNKVTKYYRTVALEEAQALVGLFGEGSEAIVTTKNTRDTPTSAVVLTLGTLPERTTVIYFGCAAPASSKPGPQAMAASKTAKTPRTPVVVPPVVASGFRGQSNRSADSAGGSVLALAAGPRRLMVVASGSHETRKSAIERKAIPEEEEGEEVVGPSPSKCVIKLLRLSIRVSFPPLLSRGPLHPRTPSSSSLMCAACTVEKKNMAMEITSESKSVAFQCDTHISTLSPTDSTTNIFDESCENEVTLVEKVPSASLTTTNSGYTFRVEELPETAITFCYKCSASSDSGKTNPPQEESMEKKDACIVKINVSAANLDSDASTSATARSVTSLVFASFISLCFSMAVF
uniref:SRS domain-containing protein n=1 Tax=Neospora caninum (strain Liverpool) TaxID=572307 RepID=F0JB52_NEOCL|nr:SRS domain-containing protein [Neospora caninum Liverpool]CEL71319.1 TPA: SRS domain-containing protein [Neospora caninum Liverpool]